MKWNKITAIVNSLAVIFTEKNIKLAVAESCTGGLISAAITEISGSSFWFERGFVTYSNLAKQELLDVPEEIILEKGAVNKDVAALMAEGCLKRSAADVSLSVTGVAGPSGGGSDKPVGTVFFAWAADKKDTLSKKKHFTGDRQEVRFQSCHFALQQLYEFISES